MSENIKQFIDQLAAGEVAEAKDTLENELASRSFAALDEYKKLIGQNIFGGNEESEVEVQNEEEVELEEKVIEKPAAYADQHVGNYTLKHMGGEKQKYRTGGTPVSEVKDKFHVYHKGEKVGELNSKQTMQHGSSFRGPKIINHAQHYSGEIHGKKFNNVRHDGSEQDFLKKHLSIK